MKYSVAFLCHLLPKRRCNLMQGQQRVALQWHQQAIAHPQATRCLHTSFEKICEASRMVNPNIFAKPTGHQNPINTNIIFRNLCGKLLMIDFVKMAKTPTPRHQGAQIQGTTEDRAPTPNSIIIVVQRSRKHQDKSTSLDKIWCEKPPHQTKISFPEKPTKNIPIKKGCLLDNDPFLIYKIVLVLFLGGGPKIPFIFSIGDELDPRHGTARRWRLQSRWKVLQGKNIGWIFAIEWQIHIKTSKGTFSPAIMEMETTRNERKLILEIHPFSSEPWLWEERYLFLGGFEATKDKTHP